MILYRGEMILYRGEIVLHRAEIVLHRAEIVLYQVQCHFCGLQNDFFRLLLGSTAFHPTYNSNPPTSIEM